MLERSDHVRDRHARFRARVKAGIAEAEACDRDAVDAGITRMLADAARR